MAADEDRRAGGLHLVPVADVDERQASREVDGRAEVDRQARPPERPTELNGRREQLAPVDVVERGDAAALADALADRRRPRAIFTRATAAGPPAPSRAAVGSVCLGHVVLSRSAAPRSAACRRANLREVGAGSRAADGTDVFFVLQDDTEALVDQLRRQLARPSEIRAAAQSRVSAMPGTFVRSASRRRWTNPTTSRASCSGALGTRVRTISYSFWSVG